jgi:hypothetical protein
MKEGEAHKELLDNGKINWVKHSPLRRGFRGAEWETKKVTRQEEQDCYGRVIVVV